MKLASVTFKTPNGWLESDVWKEREEFLNSTDANVLFNSEYLVGKYDDISYQNENLLPLAEETPLVAPDYSKHEINKWDRYNETMEDVFTEIFDDFYDD